MELSSMDRIRPGWRVILFRPRTIGGSVLGTFRQITGSWINPNEPAYGIEMDNQPYVLESVRASQIQAIFSNEESK